jgi:hypothetical protein
MLHYLLFVIFILWIHLNEQNWFGNIKLIHDLLFLGKDKTPFMALINKLKNFKNQQV